jgi:hypothetical protein
MRIGAFGGGSLASGADALLTDERLATSSYATGNMARRFRSNTEYPSEWSPYFLFANGEAGAWYDPSDFSTLFQDAAGTIPVTALGQPVGRVLDKSWNGSHLIQPSAASRPTVQARANLLERTEEFGDAYWSKSAATITSDTDVSPDGTSTADRINLTAVNTVHGAFRSVGTVASASYTLTVYIKAGTSSVAFVGSNITSEPFAYFDVSGSGSVGNVQTGCTADIQSVGNGWFRCRVVGPAISSTTRFAVFIAQSNGVIVFAGNGTETLLVWGADIRLTADGVNLPVYQRVVTATDYADIGLPRYLQFDGFDDSLYTAANLDLSGTDKVSVFAGVTKLSDAAPGIVAELSATPASNAGTFTLTAPESTTIRYASFARGSAAIAPALRANITGTGTAPDQAVITATNDIAGDLSTISRNRVAGTGATADKGTGNFGSYVFYVGRRNNASLPFNGHLNALIVRGSLTDPTTLALAEQWVAAKTGVPL